MYFTRNYIWQNETSIWRFMGHLDKDEKYKDIKSKDDLDQVLKHLRDEKKIKYLETEVIRLIL